MSNCSSRLRASVSSLIILALIFIPWLAESASAKPSEAQLIVDQINAAIKAKGAKWTAGETSAMYRSKSELCGYVGLDKSKKPATALASNLATDGITSLPTSWDWRNKDGHDWTTRVQDQMGCGSCFVFSACATAEHCMKVQSGSNGWQGNPDFSEQYLMSCAGYTCAGGSPRVVLGFLVTDGAPDEACFPYTSDDDEPCSNRCTSWSDRIVKLHNWADPEPDGAASVEQIKQAVMDFGCISAGFEVMTDFKSYNGGVYEYVWGVEEGGHAIAIVGWNDADQCWICKNSWGTDWGETKDFQPHTPGAGNGGYFRIKWGQCWIGDGACHAIGTLPDFDRSNLTGSTPPGWSNDIVPRNTAGATTGSCVYGSKLDGSVANTYVNYAGINNGLIRSSTFGCSTILDGVQISTAGYATTDPGERFYKTNAGPIAVPGGRHTLSVLIDYYDSVFESDESLEDNTICGQYVWSPTAIGRNTYIPRSAPPIKESCAGTAYNCDGFSVGAGSVGGDGYWSAVAALPSDTANYGVRIYDRNTYSGNFNGFGNSFLIESANPSTAYHYALINTRLAPAGTYYAGMVNMDGDSSPYQLQHAASTAVSAGPGTQWNEIHSLSANAVIDLYEAYLPAGSYGFRLNQIAGEANLGMAVYRDTLSFCVPALATAVSEGESSGNRSASCTVATAGYYAVAVYKRDHEGIGQSASYKLAIARDGVYLTAPNGGETLGLSERHRLTWASFGAVGDSVKIEISRDGGSTWQTITPSTPNDGGYEWNVSGAVSSHCKIRVASTSNPCYSDVSDAVFSIVSRSIQLIAPAAGETIELNFPYVIAWSSTNVTGNVKVELSSDSGATWTSLSDDWENSGMMFWYVTGPASNKCRIRVSSVEAPACYDTSDGDFTISGPTITVTSPGDDDTWFTGTQQDITWISYDVSSNVKIEISRDGGSTWSTLLANTPNDGSEQWTVTGPDSANCQFKITSVTTSYVFGISDGSFEIVTPSIMVKSPSPNVGLMIPNGVFISWDSVPMVGEVKVELSRNNGVSWETLADRTPNDGEFRWTPSTGPSSTQCLVRVSLADDPSVSDVMDGTFKLLGQSITLAAPNGGETVYAGEPVDITWTSDSVYGHLQIEISRDSGTTWTLIESQIVNDGSYTWTPDLPVSSNCRVRVSSLDYPLVKDESNADFTVQEREIVVTAPNGGERLCTGLTKEIRWTSTNVPGNIVVSLSRDGGLTWSMLGSSKLNTGKFAWTVDLPLSDNCLVKVESTLYPASDTSDAAFRITDAALDVTYPNGDESLIAGQPVTVTWTSCNIASNVDLALSRDGGRSWTTLVSNTANDGSESGVFAGPDSDNCRVRVTPVGQPALADTSDADFEIITRSVIVTYPNGGELWSVGKPVNITWNTLNTPGPVKIELTTNRGISYTTLANNWTTPGQFPWTVQNLLGTQCRIRVTSVDYPVVTDRSNTDFEITNSYIDVTAPNGGEEYTVGETYNITWASANLPAGDCSIELSRDGGGLWEPLFASVPNTGSKTWTVASKASTRCRIRITSLGNPAIKDASDADFSIVLRTLTLTSPNGGELWGIGQDREITWTSANLDSKVKIELSRDRGNTFSTLVDLYANTGSYPWTVAGPTSPDCRVRITSVDYPSVSDISTDIFTIATQTSVPCEVVLDDWIPSPAGRTVEVQVRRTGETSPIETHEITLDAQSKALFTTALSGTYDLAFKASHWLRATAERVDITSSMPTVQIRLPNGDCNEDNVVDGEDLNVVVKEWSRTAFNSPNADLNGDGRCDAFDLSIIRQNTGARGVEALAAGAGLIMWLGDESGAPLDVIETVAGEPFKVYVWAATTEPTWFLDAAVGFDTTNSEGIFASPISGKIELADGNPDGNIEWGDALSAYTLPLQSDLCGLYKQSGGIRPFGANFACALMDGSVPRTDRLYVGQVALRHRMEPGDTATVSLWDDGSGTAGGLNTMVFGSSPVYGAADTVQIVSYIADTIPEAKSAADKEPASIKAAAVSAVFRDCFYIETDDQSIGIQVYSEGHTVSAGQRVDVAGSVYTNDSGEKCIRASAVDASGSFAVMPVGITCRDLGGIDWRYNENNGAGQRGVAGGIGLNNVGLFVKLFGEVTGSTSEYFYIEDGSALDDGSGLRGVRVIMNGLNRPSAQTRVVVEGISSCFVDNGVVYRQVSATSVQECR